jgi:hypothetical protein
MMATAMVQVIMKETVLNGDHVDAVGNDNCRDNFHMRACNML